jgi:asparagine N-glycosylation enzyme membrane subunit Stt3
VIRLFFPLFTLVALWMPIIGLAVYRALENWTERPRRQRVLIAVAAGLGWLATLVWQMWELPFHQTISFVGAAPVYAALAYIVITLPNTPWRRRVLHTSLTLIFALFFVIDTVTLDGTDGVLLSLSGDHTEYASSFSDAGFRRIKVGMRPADVEALVGRPLDEWKASNDGGRVRWRWARSRDHSKDYRSRGVTFLDGRVEEKWAFVNSPM